MSDTTSPATAVAASRQPVEQNITPKSGVSIALAITLVGGVAFNLNFLAVMRERMVKIESKFENQGDTLRRVEVSLSEIKAGFSIQLNGVQDDIRDVRAENAMLRERLGKVETALESKK